MFLACTTCERVVQGPAVWEAGTQHTVAPRDSGENPRCCRCCPYMPETYQA